MTTGRWIAAGWMAGASLLGGAAHQAAGQTMVPTGQVRAISGHSRSVDQFGNATESGEQLSEAPAGDFGTWFGMLGIPGYISGSGLQTGGFDGIDAIVLEAFSMNLGGGNAPGTQAESTLRNEFTYTFTVPAASTYALDAGVGCAGPGGAPDTVVTFSVVLTLTGPGGQVFRYATGPENGFSIAAVGQTGALPAGSYTLSWVGDGFVSFVAPADGLGNGAGGGAGGAQPFMTFRVTAATGGCRADFNGSGAVDVADIFSFLSAWFSNAPGSDFDSSGATDVADIFAFLSAWFANC